MLRMGIDDAGRGPVMGPMILAACLVTPEAERELKKLGVDDSKVITQKRREFLEEKIKERVEAYEIAIVYPNEIDSTNAKGLKLNELEAVHAARLINKINKGYGEIEVFVDCPSPTIYKWQDYLKTKIKNLSNLKLSCEHKADKNHVSVSAASILAKCVREKEVGKLKKIYGEQIGSGYPSDPLTCKFLEKNALKLKEDGIFRQTWITWKKACDNLRQKKLF